MTQYRNTKLQKSTKIIRTRIIVKPCYIGNKNSVDVFTEIITRNMNMRKLKQLED